MAFSTGTAPDSVGDLPIDIGRPAPRWLSAIELWHAAIAHPGVLVLEALIVAGAFRQVEGSGRVAVAAGGAFVVLSLLTGLSAQRTTVQAQGIRWYVRPLAIVEVAMLALAWLFQPRGVTPAQSTAALILVTTYLIGTRALAWIVIAAARRRGLGLRRALVIGPNGRVGEVAAEMASHKEAGLRFAAAYTPTLPDREAAEDGRALAFSLLQHNEVDHVLLVNDGIEESVFREFVTWADDRRGYTLVLPLADIVRHGSKYHVGRFPVVPLPIGLSRNGLAAKRALDVAAATTLLVLTAPLMLLIAAAIRLVDRNRVFFRQDRVGRHGEVFSLLKFRTMDGSPDEHGEADAHWATSNLGEAPDSGRPALDRQTPLGRILRRWDLDELPQLFNVVRGDMSLVGPRPERVSYVARFARAIEGYDDRHRVRPGMTGWAQINGLRGQTPLGLRTAFDNDYVNNWSFWLDIKILLRTPPAIVTVRSPNLDQLLSSPVEPSPLAVEPVAERAPSF